MPNTLDPWRHVDCDDDLVADLLAGTLEVIVEAGGWIHPRAVLQVREGAASVVCLGGEGELLLRVPRSCFLPIMRVEWGRQDDALEMLALPDDITDLERELLLLQVAFHNARGALPALVRTHPAAAADLCDDVIDAVRALRPDFRMHAASSIDLFWTARAFRVPVYPGGTLDPVGVPLIDLLDHHAGGATPTLMADGFEVPVRTPVGSSCRLDYGRERDALDLAIVYGFADTSATIAHCAPLHVEVADVGPVEVLARGTRGDGALLAPVGRRTADGWQLSHLSFAVDDPGRAAREAAVALGVTPREGGLIADAVAAENLVLLAMLCERAAACLSPAAGVLQAAAVHQAGVISPA